MKRLAFALFATTSALAMAPAALAQDDSTLEEVVVTGTRIQSAGFQAPTPLTVVTGEQLQQAAPSGIATGLNQLPQFLNSQSPRTVQASVLNQPKGNILNLRGVGAERTLILLDGVRVPPTTIRGLVDVNLMPELLVSRVDVVTGGVSAVYGSDAVSGVVNYVLDKNFTGLRGLVQGGVSDKNDAGSYKAALAFGAGLMDGRLRVLVNVDRTYQDGILRNERKLADQFWFAGPKYFPGTLTPNGTIAGPQGTTANPLVFRRSVITTTASPGGYIQTGVPGLVDKEFDANGRLVQSPIGIPFGQTTEIRPSTLNGIPGNRTLITDSWIDHGFGRIAYDLSDNLNIWGEVNASKSRVEYGSAINFGNLPIYSGNAFLPPEAQALIDASGGTNAATTTACAFGVGGPAAFCLTRVPGSDLGLPNQEEVTKTLSFRAGLTGELADWKWDLTYTHGKVKQRAAEGNQFENQRYRAALDAVRDPATGAIVCRVALTNPGRYPGCVPINIFGENRASQAALDYVRGTSIFEVENTMNDVTFGVSGELFETWAGPIGWAFSGEWRNGKLVVDSNSNPGVPIDYTGIRGAAPNLSRFSITSVGLANGKNNVKEASAEVLVPLAADSPFAKSLSFTGAIRYTDYSTSGGVTTWKAGGTWDPIEDVRFRLTRSRDIRAPNLFELFAGPTAQFGSVFDVHCQCTRQSGAVIRGGGNPDLTPEIANTFSLGLVFKPSWIPRFTASVDYYDLKIKDAIQTLTALQVIQLCEDSGGTGPACAGISRPTPFSDRSIASAATDIFAGNINAANVRTTGIDFEGSYTLPMDVLQDDLNGAVNFRLLATYVSRYDTQAFASAPLVPVVGVTEGPVANLVVPKWRASLSANYKNGPLSVFYQVRMIGSVRPGRTNVYEVTRLPRVWYSDLTTTYTVKTLGGDVDLFATVNNLFNQPPPLYPGNAVPGVAYPTILSLYDVIGRYYTVGAKFKF